MTGEKRGRGRELRIAEVMRDSGCISYRLAWGQADVISLKAGARPLLIQVKSTAQGPFERFGPTERANLLAEAIAAGADCTLAWWPKNGPLRWVAPEEWPDRARKAA